MQCAVESNAARATKPRDLALESDLTGLLERSMLLPCWCLPYFTQSNS